MGFNNHAAERPDETADVSRFCFFLVLLEVLSEGGQEGGGPGGGQGAPGLC